MTKRAQRIPISEQANVPGGLMSLDPGTVPGKRPPGFGRKSYERLQDAGQLIAAPHNLTNVP